MREKRVKTDKKWYIFLSLPVLFLSTWIYRDPNFDTSNMEVAYIRGVVLIVISEKVEMIFFLQFERRIMNMLSTSVFIQLNKTDCGEIDGGGEAQPQ